MIIIEDLTVSYNGDQLVLDDLTLELDKPGIVGLIGPNGAGKSTLLKAILGLIPYQGKVMVAGQTGRAARQHLAYVEQKSQIDLTFPMTVREAVSLGFYRKRGLFQGLTKTDWARVDEVLADLELTDLATRPISDLSGGQFQRVLVARCLVQEADVLLLDEPFVGIDAVSEHLIMTLLRQLKEAGKTILIVHHDLSKVRAYFDQLLLIKGRLIAFGEIDQVYTPKNLKLAYGDLFYNAEEVGHA